MKKIYAKIKILTVILMLGAVNGILAQTTVKPIVRLTLTNANHNDETVFYFEQGGTTAFQPAFDAYKLLSGNQPYIGSMSDSILTSISGLPQLPANLNIPVKAITPFTGNFTFSASKENFPDGICVTLHDAFTGTNTNILTSDYVCTLYDTTSIARFSMNFFTTELQVSSHVNQPDCQTPDGMIVVKGDGTFNFEWKNATGIIKTSFNKASGDTLPNLKNGTYTLNISKTGGCASTSSSFVIKPVIKPIASFSSDLSSNVLSNTELVNFTNNSTNAYYSSWDFGDKSGIWFLTNPSHHYLEPGTYTVTLTTESIHHCTDQAQKVITVVDGLTGINSPSLSSDIKLFTYAQGYYSINFKNTVSDNYIITVSDLNGNLITTKQLGQVTNINETIDLSLVPSGMYLLMVSNNNHVLKTFKLVK